MGFDAFGLPAENYAIQTGTHPAVTTMANIERFSEQIKSLGFSYDWDREISTCDPTTTDGRSGYSSSSSRAASPTKPTCPSTGAHPARPGSPTRRSRTGNATAAAPRSVARGSANGCSRSPPTRSGSSRTSTSLDWPKPSSSCSATGSAAARARTSASRSKCVGPERRAGAIESLHDPSGHALRRHLHGARPRASPRGRDHRRGPAARP